MPAEYNTFGPFITGDWVVYNPNMPDLKPIRERVYDIGRIIAADDAYYTIQFVFGQWPYGAGRTEHILRGPIDIDGAPYYPLTALPADIRDELLVNNAPIDVPLQRHPQVPRLQIPPVDPNIFDN